mgnify:CR=1 FL=1
MAYAIPWEEPANAVGVNKTKPLGMWSMLNAPQCECGEKLTKGEVRIYELANGQEFYMDRRECNCGKIYQVVSSLLCAEGDND